jgi:uroporphyrinogen III methyltransferase/synthase
MGAVVDEVIIYRSETTARIDAAQRQDLIDGNCDYITFTSSSTVTNFVNIIGPGNVIHMNAGTKVACIGPITARTAEEYGFTVDVMPDRYTIEALVDAIIADRVASTISLDAES